MALDDTRKTLLSQLPQVSRVLHFPHVKPMLEHVSENILLELIRNELQEIRETVMKASDTEVQSFDVSQESVEHRIVELVENLIQPEETKNFDIHYLTFSASGWASEDIYYFGEFELEHGGTGGDNTFVEQAYIDYWIFPTAAVKIGALLTPFNRFDEFHGPLENVLITRPQAARQLGVSAWKDVGIDLHGYFHLNSDNSIMFNLYTINGLGSGPDLRSSRQYRDNNEKKSYGIRLNLLHKHFLEIGGSAYTGKWDDEGEYTLTLFGGHLMLNTPFGDIYGEYSHASSENPSPFDDGEMNGFFIQGSKLLRGKYRPTVRIGKLDYLDNGNALGRSSSKGNKDVTEYVFGFSFYPVPNVAFKIEYAVFEEGTRVADKNNNQFGFQATVKY